MVSAGDVSPDRGEVKGAHSRDCAELLSLLLLLVVRVG